MKQKGFTLIELLLVLGIATVMGITAIHAAKKEGEQQLSYAAATQINELSAALTKQISRNYSAYTLAPRTTITIADLQAQGLLPNVYLNQTPFGGTMQMEAVSTGGATPSVTGLITTTPWTSPDGNPRYDLLGATIRKMGAQGGVTYYSSSVVAGLNGAWSASAGVNPGEFSFINTPGQLAMRIYVDAAGQDGVYLRRDGMLPMLGNLDMGFHDINNAVNISANGWVYANHIAANDATLGSIFSNYIRNTGGIDTAQITGIGSSSVANFEFLTARTRINTPDIVVTNTTSTGKVQLNDTVVVGAACTPDGLQSKDSTGFLVSCVSGIWKKAIFSPLNFISGSFGGDGTAYIGRYTFCNFSAYFFNINNSVYNYAGVYPSGAIDSNGRTDWYIYVSNGTGGLPASYVCFNV